MQVTNGAANYTIGWFYGNPQLDQLLEDANISGEDARKMKKSELAEKLGLQTLPLPSHTECIIRNGEGDEIAHAEVVKHVGDVYNKDKARKAALKKVLTALFPNYEDKTVRGAFWKVYLRRGPSNEEKLFARLLTKYGQTVPVPHA